LILTRSFRYYYTPFPDEAVEPIMVLQGECHARCVSVGRRREEVELRLLREEKEREKRRPEKVREEEAVGYVRISRQKVIMIIPKRGIPRDDWNRVYKRVALEGIHNFCFEVGSGGIHGLAID
jgi:hypothetical protein